MDRTQRLGWNHVFLLVVLICIAEWRVQLCDAAFVPPSPLPQSPMLPLSRTQKPMIGLSSKRTTTSSICQSITTLNVLADPNYYNFREGSPLSLQDACPSQFQGHPEWESFLETLRKEGGSNLYDPLWEKIKAEALEACEPEPEAGPQIYQGVLSQPSLLEAVVTIISNEISSQLMPATTIKSLFLDLLTPEDNVAIHKDVLAAVIRSPSVKTALTATLFQTGFHTLLCYRLGHRLWEAGRTGLAYFMQSTVSAHFSADIHPASKIGSGIYLKCQGVVIGETAVVGEDASILQAVTLGGTGKESGDRHPKVGNGVILQSYATVLGNIRVGDGAIITAKSIVTKPVPPLAIMTGVPAKLVNYRELDPSTFETDDLQMDLAFKYLEPWLKIKQEIDAEAGSPFEI